MGDSGVAKGRQKSGTARARRILCTVLFTDIVDSTAHAARLGDRKWKQLLDRHDTLSRAQLKKHGGKEVRTVGDGFLATFDSPDRAIGCARAIAEAVSELGIHVRAGLHTGQCELQGSEISGIAVHIAKRICELADADEVLLTQVVKDLVVEIGRAHF
jgi:class 3 adenylate cyclase